ncbi:coenzyme F420-0:L-glutamate ligase/coenzyme F420-1:gamma-L-glutamate ligase [Sinobacterium caligoides]|uniref:Coenzyme F420-0:L-glutamate ligase/coenzyme F420-1:gamma-L-glutamate ligase n=1 Tax=Sinobacterium caligoides TaxID=933926 RepID=A0A3N2DMW6_9GAMM|nr:coenzyme F420-0:L-glutamate ligase [Sinobacterium caligoides]ROS01153.1 coenzyme F420-0:L-glutamate ligase/coenzyme F420-1:gamma-L-glutamate ligase [Sinobacterium caligoides]
MQFTTRVLPGVPHVEPGDDLLAICCEAFAAAGTTPVTGDVLVLAQKIVSKSEGRYAILDEVIPSPEALLWAEKVDKDPRLVELILSESVEVVRHRPGVMIVQHRLGYVHANAGIDRSNITVSEDGRERVLLLPEDSDRSAALLRQGIAERYGCDVKIVIADSAGRAWRNGITGMTIGSAGFDPVQDQVGCEDLYGRPLEVTTIAVADEIACAASLLMGQGNQGAPLVLLSGLELPSSESGSRSLIRDKDADLFR